MSKLLELLITDRAPFMEKPLLGRHTSHNIANVFVPDEAHAFQAKRLTSILFISFRLHVYQQTTEIRILSVRELSNLFQWRN